MLTRLNTQRQDHLPQASELVAFAIDFEISMRRQGNSGAFGSSGRGGRGRGGRIPNGGRGDQGGRGGGYIARVSSVETRTCYACGEVGHIKPNCPNKSENQSSTTSNRVVLAVGTGTEADTGYGSSVHLVHEVSMLKNAMECNQICRVANNTMVRVTKVGAVELRTVVDGKEVVVDLTEVYYSENLADNIISYGTLEERGVFFERHHGKSYVVRQSNMQRVFEVHRRNNVLMVDIMGEKTKEARERVVNTAVREANAEIDDAVTATTLQELHQRLGHLAYATVHDKFRGLLNELREGNKVTATKMFEHFLVYFEKRFNCMIHVLRTDGGKEYVNVDPFCKSTGVRSQKSEAGNQASNGKAERMHRT
ncbi:Hypothetical protein PHPALM_20125, partial [Phytophthora palmivora]